MKTNEAIKALRIKAGMNQTELCNKAGIKSVPRYSEFESGSRTNVNLDYLDKILSVFGRKARITFMKVG